MPEDNSNPSKRRSGSTANRRRFLQAAGVTTAVGLTGCTGFFGGGGGGGGGDDGVQYWTLFGGGDGETMKNMVNTAKDEHDLDVSRQRQPFDDYYDKLFTSLTGGQAPDVAVLHADRMAAYKDLIEPLGDEIGTDPYVENIASKGVVDGEQLAVPLDSHPYGLYYNKDVFEEAGLDPENPPNTPERFQEACQAITENTDYWAGQYHSGGFHVSMLKMFLSSRGGQLLTDDNAPAFNNDNGLAVAEYLNSWVNENNWVPQSSDKGWQAWQRGEAGFLFDGTWHLGVVRGLDFDWGMTKPFVMPDSEAPKTVANSHMLVMPQSSSRSDETREDAYELMRLLSQDYNHLWGSDAGHLPASQSALESDDLRNSDTWDQTLNTFYEMAQDDQLSYMPATEKNGEYQQAIYQQLDDMRLGNIGPQTAIENAAEGVNQVFQ